MRGIDVIEGSKPASDYDWETVKKGGDTAIEKWIADQIKGWSCTVVLVGTKTARRKWITYEIIQSWNKKMGVVGIYIHGLTNSDGKVSNKGRKPVWLNSL